jgi:hypothetical protein
LEDLVDTLDNDIQSFDLLNCEVIDQSNLHDDIHDVNARLDKNINGGNTYIGQQVIMNAPVITKDDVLEADQRNLIHDSRSDLQKQADLVDKITVIFDQYKAKYDVALKFEEFTEFVCNAITISRNEAEVKTLIQSDLISNMAAYIIFKGLMVSARIIDANLTAAQEVAISDPMSPESVCIVDRIFGWIDRMKQVQEMYSEFNIDEKIKVIRERSARGGGKSGKEAEEENKNRQLLIQQLLTSIASDRLVDQKPDKKS